MAGQSRGEGAGDEGGAVPRVPPVLRGFHGAVGTRELGSASVREVVLGRRAIGGARIEALTGLARGAPGRSLPTIAAGGRHVARNARGATSSARAGGPAAGIARAHVPAGDDGARAVVAPRTAAAPGPTSSTDVVESTEDYLERRVRDASFVFLPNRSRGYAVVKRAIDLVGALVLLAVFAPVIVVLAVAIRLDSPGPAIFSQQRVTRAGRHFTFYKFRTMHVDARERFPDLYAYDFADTDLDSAYYKLADDPRNTRVGRWLRRTTLDELPNLFNVIKGDLSLVGPRPDLPELVRHYRPEELACLFTKAGLTGLAQVSGRSLLTFGERLTLDLRYVAHQTLLLDLRILVRTVVVVLTGRGAF